jgi:hypothetical protein
MRTTPCPLPIPTGQGLRWKAQTGGKEFCDSRLIRQRIGVFSTMILADLSEVGGTFI